MFDRSLLILEVPYTEHENIALNHVFSYLEAALKEERLLQKIKSEVPDYLGFVIQQI